jgi:hypothetical protein
MPIRSARGHKFRQDLDLHFLHHPVAMGLDGKLARRRPVPSALGSRCSTLANPLRRRCYAVSWCRCSLPVSDALPCRLSHVGTARSRHRDQGYGDGSSLQRTVPDKDAHDRRSGSQVERRSGGRSRQGAGGIRREPSTRSVARMGAREERLVHLALDPRYFEQAHNRDCDYQRQRDEVPRNHRALSRSTWVRPCIGARLRGQARLPVLERCLRGSLEGRGGDHSYARGSGAKRARMPHQQSSR